MSEQSSTHDAGSLASTVRAAQAGDAAELERLVGRYAIVSIACRCE
jgi:hypothetical protein